MPEITEAELKKQLAADEFHRVYLIAGEEKYLVKRNAARLIKKAAGESFLEFNSNEFCNESSVDSIADAATALPFFAERKCVSVTDFNIDEKDTTELAKLYELIDDVPESTVLVLRYPTLEFDAKKAAKWKKLIKAVQEKGAVLICGRRSMAELVKLIMREADKAGCIMSRQNAERIIEYAGQDVTRLLNEVEKLCAFALGGAENTAVPEITAEMIETLVSKSTETTVFLMSGALVAGNYEKAYKLLDVLFYQNEEPIAVLGALSSAYVDMYRVKTAVESGKQSSSAAAYGDYKGKEFRLRNAERSARGLKPEALRASLALLLDADMALKSSRLDGRIILEELVAKLLLAAKGAGTY